MPVSPTYPGVYIEEIPSGVRTITGVATSITAFLGRAPRGPTNDPVTITSFADFERRFGGLAAAYPMSYAVRDFYQNGGSTAIIVRLYQAAAPPPPPAPPAPPGPPGPPAPPAPPGPPAPPAPPAPDAGMAKITVGNLKLKAASPGAWGNKLRVEVKVITDPEAKAAYGLAPGDDLFNLTARDTSPGGATEQLLNLAVLSTAVRRIDQVLAQEASLLRWDGDSWPTPDPQVDADAKDDTAAKETAAADALRDFKLKKADWIEKKNTLPPSDPAIPAAKAAMDAAEVVLKAAVDDVTKAEEARGGANSDKLDPAAYIGTSDPLTGMQALTKTDLFNLLCIPPDRHGQDTHATVYQTALQLCVEKRAMLIVDTPAAWSANRDTAVSKAMAGLTDLGLNGVAARNAALYFPRVHQSDPLRDDRIETFVPCGIIAGVMARTDSQRGVWKAPAGLDAGMSGIVAPNVVLNDNENGLLNPLGINVLRAFPVYGNVVWGARTLRGADQLADEYKYVPVRRLALFIEESLFRGTKWVVFEPNDEPLWAQIRLNIGAFMHNLFRQGAFQGTTPKDAYFVKCDHESTTQNDINLGIVNIIVGFAPLKPAEFVIIKLQQIAGKIDV